MENMEVSIIDKVDKAEDVWLASQDGKTLIGIQSDRVLEIGEAYFLFNVSRAGFRGYREFGHDFRL